MNFPNEWQFSPRTLDELLDLARAATLWEISNELKPGNVNPIQSIGDLTYENMIRGIDAIIDTARNFFAGPSDSDLINDQTLTVTNSTKSLGYFIYSMVDAMLKAQNSGNVLLGHILLYAPLLFAFNQLQSFSNEDIIDKWSPCWEIVDRILHQTTSEDAIWLSRAILLAQPGGLITPGGKELPSAYDLTDADIELRIVSEDRNLLNLFEESASFDMIAKQYTTSYAFIQEILCNWAINHQFEYLDAAEFICDLFLQIMARVPDSLIFRKNSQECAEQIRLEAEKIVELGGILTEAGKNQISDFNDRLLAKKGKLNPGTTADLTACAIFLGMCFGQLIILTN